MRKKLTTSALVKKLDREFSRFIRMKSADEGGTVSCVTCGKLMHWKDAHNAHFVSRRHMSLRFSELNCHPCCPRCNVFEAGNMVEYADFIIRTYGKQVFDELLRMKRETKKWTREELESLIEKYKTLADSLESRLSPV